jgi:hypothetical protein
MHERKARLLREVEQCQRDVDHWNRLNPDEEPLAGFEAERAMVEAIQLPPLADGAR